MRSIDGRRLARVVEERGWRLLRVNGSHHVYGKDGERARLTIPIHGAAPLKVGLLRHLIKLAGLTDADLG